MRRSALVVSLVLVTGCASRVSVRAEAEIGAPADVVWEVLTDTARYPEWNPLTRAIEGRLAVGQAVHLHVALAPGRRERRQRQRVLALEPQRLIRWETSVVCARCLTARREQEVAALGDGSSRYRTTDTMSGSLVPLVMSLYREDLQQGFERMVAALKARAEEVARQRRGELK